MLFLGGRIHVSVAQVVHCLVLKVSRLLKLLLRLLMPLSRLLLTIAVHPIHFPFGLVADALLLLHLLAVAVLSGLGVLRSLFLLFSELIQILLLLGLPALLLKLLPHFCATHLAELPVSVKQRIVFMHTKLRIKPEVLGKHASLCGVILWNELVPVHI